MSKKKPGADIETFDAWDFDKNTQVDPLLLPAF